MCDITCFNSDHSESLNVLDITYFIPHYRPTRRCNVCNACFTPDHTESDSVCDICFSPEHIVNSSV